MTFRKVIASYSDRDLAMHEARRLGLEVEWNGQYMMPLYRIFANDENL